MIRQPGALLLLFYSTLWAATTCKANNTSSFEFDSSHRALQSECCVNTATNTCHSDDKCNKKEDKCKKCDKKAKNTTYNWQQLSGDPPSPPSPTPPPPPPSGPPPPPPPPSSPTPPAPPPADPCCLNTVTNTCHTSNKCNKKEKDCVKCAKKGPYEWKAPITQTPAPTTSNPTASPTTVAPTSSPTTLAPTSFPTAVPTNVVTSSPTSAPTTSNPTNFPTPVPSNAPTKVPTAMPSNVQSDSPTKNPTAPYHTVTTDDLPPANAAAARPAPLKGFLTSPEWHTGGYTDPQYNNDPESTMEFYYIGLSDVMTGMTDFPGFDTIVEPRVAASASRGKHSILRFYMDYPQPEGSYVSHTPQFLIDDYNLQMTPWTSVDLNAVGLSPDYSDGNLKTALSNFVAALGNRYDADPRIGFIQVGLLGFWGEWHTWTEDSATHSWIPDATKMELIDAFDTAFQTTQVQIRYPHWYAVGANQRQGFGLHDDSFAHSTIDEGVYDTPLSWFFWPSVEANSAENFWMSGAMGGEIRPELQSTIFDDDYEAGTPYKQDFGLCAETTHATYMLNYYAFATSYGSNANALESARAASDLMGYAFRLTEVSVAQGGEANTVDITATVVQDGIAPFYYDLGLELSCPGDFSVTLAGVDDIASEGSSSTFTFSSVPATSVCLSSLSLSLSSSYALAGAPVKFAQGSDGSVIEISLPLPPGHTSAPSQAPVKVTSSPSSQPTNQPTSSPSKSPTSPPTQSPTSVPTSAPSHAPTSSPSSSQTNSPTLPTTTLQVVFDDIGAPPNPLGSCKGDCDNDDQCEGTLKCFQRSGNEAVPGCTGNAPATIDFCAERPTENTAWLMGDNGNPSANFPLGLCSGDCDSDDECQPGLICQQRTGTEPIPGCIGSPEPGEDYCRYPELTFVGNPAPSVLGACEGDCDVDADCGPNLECFQRPGTEQVSGCLGTGDYNTDYCALRLTPNTLFLKGNNGSPSSNFPLKACEGDCDNNSECGPGLVCLQRDGYEPVPGCIGIRTYEEDYCYDPNWDSPSPPPGPPPTYAPNAFGATYVPGDLSQPCNGLMLSRGMDCRLLATAGQFVQYDTGGRSDVRMHARADGAAVIPHPSDGGWYYTSNSEEGNKDGGVGTLRFNSAGQVIGYKMDLEDTSRNCGGGKTYWDTWVTCEEDGSSGFCWEVDPFTGHTALTNAVNVGGNYESFAYDDQDPDVEARFFTTEDSGNGALVRYTPSAAAFSTGNKYDILTSPGGSYHYLVLNSDGTFEWSSSASAGANSASTYFPNSEGIDVINRQLFFVSKVNKELFELDLANMTWQVQSTVSGAFDKQPDQIQKIVGDTDFLYFCEDGGSSSDIHGRNKDGQFFTIVRGDGQNSETTGLAFSPDNKFMYVSFQGQSNIYAFWRTDGLDFGAVKADIKYHQV